MPGKDDRTYDQKRRDAQYELEQKLREGPKQAPPSSNSSSTNSSSTNPNSNKSS